MEGYEEFKDLIRPMDEYLAKALPEVKMSRTEWVLRHFVVGEKDSDAQAFIQAVIEAEVKHENMQNMLIDIEIEKERIKNLKAKGDKVSKLKALKKELGLQKAELALLAQQREYDALMKILHELPFFTRQEIDDDQPNYWKQRLYKQAALDYMATNRIGVGNLDAMRQAKLRIPNFIEVDAPNQLGYFDELTENAACQIERRYIEGGNEKILVAIPSVEKISDKPELVDALIPHYPTGKQIKNYNAYGMNIPDAFTNIVETALQDKADYILFIEDDTFAPKDGLVRLLEVMKNNPEVDAVGALYPKRMSTIQSTSMIIGEDGTRTNVPNDGKLHEVYTICFGFTLVKTKIFKRINPPWFWMSDNLTQDSFFSQKAREAGFRLFVDSSLKAKHVDRKTGEVFEYGD